MVLKFFFFFGICLSVKILTVFHWGGGDYWKENHWITLFQIKEKTEKANNYKINCN